jgi:Cyclophilin type peptidyl-prolyl cis-trans isomerase/CLD
MNQWNKVSRMKLGHILQVVIVLAVTALVWESHHKALFAAQQLTQFKEEESLLLLHLQKIEQQSIQLHENLSRLARVGLAGKAEDKNSNGEGGHDVDFDLIHKQTQQLYQMEEELNHEVKTLQTRIQQSARNHIIQEFGEGPVQVILELDFGTGGENGVNPIGGVSDAGPNRIAILLWHDTPHAAWTWLEQIGRNIWDGAEFQWKQGHIIDAVPHEVDPLGGKIEFVEQSQHGHEAWTVGMREDDSGAMGMYINLQDNTNVHKHETCVGKVIDGFDALQRLLEVARSQRNAKDVIISIRKATAMHVTKK